MLPDFHLVVLPAALALVTLGCGGACPAGFVLDGEGRCVAVALTVDGGRDGGGDAAADVGGDAYRADTGADGGPCAACGGATPHCVADECVACADDDDCMGTERCELTMHECVACLGTAGDACPSATPVCDTSALECVGCLTSTDCTTVAASVCTGARAWSSRSVASGHEIAIKGWVTSRELNLGRVTSRER